MKPLGEAIASEFAGVRFVLTDMDETLTFEGRLHADTYTALERLQRAGLKVIPVTAAPAGWCDQMARMWPVDGVIGENGGLFFRRGEAHLLMRSYWHTDGAYDSTRQELDRIALRVLSDIPGSRLADDQPFRLTSIAFARSKDDELEEAILSSLRTAGADATVNNLWILGWLGGYDKLTMARRVLAETYGLDIDADREAVLYSGDSTNDAPMFAFFRHTVGVSTVIDYLPKIPKPPAWITRGPGGTGFVEIADALLARERDNHRRMR